jgi:hypothetical protein
MKQFIKTTFLMTLIIGITFTFSACDLLGEDDLDTTHAITIAGSVGGSVTGGNLYEDGTTVNITATPNEGYIFWKWVEKNEIISTELDHSFVADESTSVVAYFLLEDQNHLEGTYYLYQSLYAGSSLFNAGDEMIRYTLSSDNSYNIEAFSTTTGTWNLTETGDYINDNGVSITLDNSQEERRLTYNLNDQTGEIEFHYLEIDGQNQRTIYNTLIPWPETPFRVEHEYTLLAGVEDDASIIIDELEPEVFELLNNGTFTWSYFEQSIQEVRTGTYEIIGNSILLTEVGDIYTIYEVDFETQAGVEHSRFILQKRHDNGLTYESRIFEFDYLA